jgi:hypothetical protein
LVGKKEGKNPRQEAQKIEPYPNGEFNEMGIVSLDDCFGIGARYRRDLLVMNFPLNLYLDEK